MHIDVSLVYILSTIININNTQSIYTIAEKFMIKYNINIYMIFTVGILSLCSLKRVNEKLRKNKIFEFPSLAKGHCPILEGKKDF